MFAPIPLCTLDNQEDYIQNSTGDYSSKESEKLSSSKSQKLTRMERLLDLDMFAHLVLKIAAVITFSSEELTWGMPKIEFKSENSRSRHKRVFSYAQIIFALSALGHGSDLSKVHDALMTLCEEPMLIRSAPPSKAQIARTHSYITGDFSMTTSSSSKIENGQLQTSNGQPQTSNGQPHIEKHHIDLVIGALSAHFLFAEMTRADLLQIARSMKTVKLRAGDTLFKQGDPSDVYYVLVEGTLSLLVDEIMIKTFNPGMGFGELSILFSTPRTASIRAPKNSENKSPGSSKDVLLCYLDRDDFLKHVNMEYTFVGGDIRRKVYAQILSKHAKEMHSIVATFLLNQRNHRKLLRGRFQNVVKKIMNFNRWNKAALLAIAHKESARVLPKTPKARMIKRTGSMAGEESFDGGGGLHIRVCEHLVRSDLSTELVIEHVERLAESAVNHRDTKMIIQWNLRLLETAFGLETSGTDVVLGYLCDQDEAITPTNSKLPQSSFAQKSIRFSRCFLDDRTGLIMYPIQPIVGYKRKKSGRKQVASSSSMSFRMSKEELEKAAEKVRLQSLISIERLSEYLLVLSESYKYCENFVTSFNLAQITLMYLGFPPTPVKSEGVYFMQRYIRPLRHGQNVRKSMKRSSARRVQLAKWAYDVSFQSIQGRYVNTSNATEMPRLERMIEMLNSAKKRFQTNTLKNSLKTDENNSPKSDISSRLEHSRNSGHFNDTASNGDSNSNSSRDIDDSRSSETPSGESKFWRVLRSISKVLGFQSS